VIVVLEVALDVVTDVVVPESVVNVMVVVFVVRDEKVSVDVALEDVTLVELDCVSVVQKPQVLSHIPAQGVLQLGQYKLAHTSNS
jgi:hypothetical protein